jgi:hypothetical protein
MSLCGALLKNSTALPEIIHTAATVRKEYKKA